MFEGSVAGGIAPPDAVWPPTTRLPAADRRPRSCVEVQLVTTTVRTPAVAGSFYPADTARLTRDLTDLLAHPAGPPLPTAPKALIVPHAGYLYSGPIAASAYATLAPQRGRITRVVLAGPSHFVPLRGLAVPKASRFRTPLGEVAVDLDGVQRVVQLPLVTISAAAHSDEHSLEVQLPFLQTVLDAFSVLPLVVGDAAPDEVAAVLEEVWGGDETLIVVSSDLSHYLPDPSARAADTQTVSDIIALRPHVGPRQACGAAPVNGLLAAAQRHGLRAVALDVRNSSQTAGDPDRVVGYAAIAFVGARPAAPPTEAKGQTLLRLARYAIGEALGVAVPEVEDAAWLDERGATFVTLTIDGELRGCIGSVTAHRALRDDVHDNALGAAFRDPRFRPLPASAFNDIRVEVSLLTPPEPMDVADEDAAIAALRPHEDGVVLEYGSFAGLFLPQVWEQLPTPRAFLRHLKRKAGLPDDFWASGIRLSRFRVRSWKEPGA